MCDDTYVIPLWAWAHRKKHGSQTTTYTDIHQILPVIDCFLGSTLFDSTEFTMGFAGYFQGNNVVSLGTVCYFKEFNTIGS